ncbi:MAG TPA: chromosomal replication initiator protein DnaA [Leucothrix mucor]|uniref:Chromosomal replication initiator protein DnaA n=1 Tax=Leucothrix mucor TaxID=45248 RepID=A0A7V2T0I2_LEUMU|nr:chromosomal replication initiator protein DnaA [Leucothrix mucor]
MLWQQCLKHLEQELPDQEINTWLRTLHGTHHDDALFLLAPNEFVLQHVRDHHLSRISECARAITTNSATQVFIQIGSSAPIVSKKQAQSATADTLTSQQPPQINEPSESFSTTISESINVQHLFTNNLNSGMIFDNFVEGKSNQLGRASALQVGDNPGLSYNPLFIYGSSGLGKTHLMHAIGNRILENDPNAHVVYLTSENFVNDLVNALRNNQINEFKTFYRTADALLIDDIQFFAGKTRSMEEFFHTFNTLLEGQKQIILTSDKYPRNVNGIDDRLRTRLNSGLSVSIDPPDLETRVAILRKKAENFSLVLPNNVSFFIAERFKSNVRDLEGALQKVVATLRLRRQTEVTLDFVHDALRDQLASQTKLITIESIKKTVAQHYNIRVSDLNSPRRTRSIARPRQIAMSLAKELTNHSYPEIGENFGGRDHTTIMHACKKVKELRHTDPQIEEGYSILQRVLTC